MRSQIHDRLHRRALLKSLAFGVGMLGAGRLSLLSAAAYPAPPGVAPDARDLQPGEYFWEPERSEAGRLSIIVSIPRQLVFVYRNGVLIGLSTCSTGMPGYSTPAGLFTVLQKFKDHRSIKYRDDMPFTLRLTKKGIALHAGDVPGYPVSHGCVHLPLSFAGDLFGLTATGTSVVIGGRADHPLVGGPGIRPAGSAGNIIAAREAARSFAPSGPDADSAVLVSSADRRIYVVQDGTIVASGPAIIKDPEQPLGTNVFIWRGGEAGSAASIWKASSFQPVPGGAVVTDAAMLARLEASDGVTGTIEKVLHPGTVLLTTDEPLGSGGQLSQPLPAKKRRTASTKRRRSRTRVAQRRR